MKTLIALGILIFVFRLAPIPESLYSPISIDQIDTDSAKTYPGQIQNCAWFVEAVK